MQPDDDLCMCFHVSLRKVVNWIRINRPRKAGQISECFGAGTGCGWCRTRLEVLHAKYADPETAQGEGDAASLPAGLFPDSGQYGSLRKDWIQAGKSALKSKPEP